MGHVLRKLGRYPDAIEFHKKALTMSPQNASFYSAIGLIYCMMGKWKEAVEHLDYVCQTHCVFFIFNSICNQFEPPLGPRTLQVAQTRGSAHKKFAGKSRVKAVRQHMPVQSCICEQVQ